MTAKRAPYVKPTVRARDEALRPFLVMLAVDGRKPSHMAGILNAVGRPSPWDGKWQATSVIRVIDRLPGFWVEVAAEKKKQMLSAQ